MSSLPPLGLDPATAAAYYHPSYLTHHPFPHPAFRWASPRSDLGVPGGCQWPEDEPWGLRRLEPDPGRMVGLP